REPEAYIVKSILEQEGIFVSVLNDSFSRIYPIGFNSIGGIRLMVRRSDLDRALDIINSLNLQGF
ncbi:MAG: DUF2007 domain-containing protein, partial [Muribaculaceae bacterium]|nr:DUF2007 domain-containing protein [Muribaculaceae bacterium]